MNEIIEAIKQSAIEIKHLIETGDTGKSEQEKLYWRYTTQTRYCQ